MSKRYLTGITPSGSPHIGNILGAILPALQFSQSEAHECFYFISDLHSLTTVKDAAIRKQFTLAIAASWLAFSFDIERNYFYRQSQIPIVTELSWYLSAVTPYMMLSNAHAFKDKSAQLQDVNVGLFTYPILMAADILLYNAHFVPVGKDQKQHVEIARDIALKYNRQYGSTFVVPEPLIQASCQTVPGTDGRKMSKSYNNYIDVFASPEQLKKQVFSIVTSSLGVAEKKNPQTCNVFALYKLIASADEVKQMEDKYISGGFGFGDAKKELLQKIITRFEKERNQYQTYISHPDKVWEVLSIGEDKAYKIAKDTIETIREQQGFDKLSAKKSNTKKSNKNSLLGTVKNSKMTKQEKKDKALSNAIEKLKRAMETENSNSVPATSLFTKT